MTRRNHHDRCGHAPFLAGSVGPLLFLCFPLLGQLSVSALDFSHHSNEKVHEILLNLSQTYSDITRLYSIGRSEQGRELWVLAVGESPAKPVLLRPNVKYVANMHGNEVVGRELLLHLAEHLVTGYGQDPKVTRLLKATTVHLLPSLNPDGYQVANTTDCKGDEGRYNANGTDLNRNFPDFFQPNNDLVIQAETRAVIDWVRDSHFALSANLHDGSRVVVYPFSSLSGNLAGPRPSLTPDDDVFQALARYYSYTNAVMSTQRACDWWRNFQDGITNSAQWYSVRGSMMDYLYTRGSTYELAVELSCCKYPPDSDLPKLWEENKRSLVVFLEQVHMGVKGLVLDDNNNTVPGALVVIQGRELVPFNTSRFGEYFKLLLPGKYTLVVSKAGVGLTTVAFQVIQNRVLRLDVRLGDVASSISNIDVTRAIAVGLVWIVFLDIAV